MRQPYLNEISHGGQICSRNSWKTRGIFATVIFLQEPARNIPLEAFGRCTCCITEERSKVITPIK